MKENQEMKFMSKFRPCSEVELEILESGAMMLATPTARTWCGPDDTVMWVALCEQGGDPQAAADRLSAVWGSSAFSVYVELMDRIEKWRRAGLLSREDIPF